MRVAQRALLLFSLLLLACGTRTKGDPPAIALQAPKITAGDIDTTFDVRDHMIAAVEMQLSGEPLAEKMGRVLSGYSRENLPPNIYFDPDPGAAPFTDLVGFSTAVESYEYSKQPMNNLSFESGAGVSLAFAPVLNPTGETGMDARTLLIQQVQLLAAESNVVTLVSFQTNPGSAPQNLLGWPGFWPVVQPYDSFDPAIQPSNQTTWYCSIASDDTPGSTGLILNQDYECDYNTLNLIDRTSQVDFVISPGSSGWAGWKSALWTTNYLQIMHDSEGNSLSAVPQADLAQVGQPGNTVIGTPSAAGTKVFPGAYIGSSTIEGFQAGMMITELDNAAQQWLTSLTTTDGVTLSGFDSIEDALSYDFTTPLRWIPDEIAVTEASDASGFPRPTDFTIQSSDSSLLDVSGLLGAYATLYALTDRNNPNVGGTQTTEVYFDGDPFPLDDGLPDGEATLHDRALGMLRFLVVTLDRLHRDPPTGYLADEVTFQGGVPTRGDTVSIASTTYALVALRTVRMALESVLSLYANTTPDTALISSPLDTIPFNGAPEEETFSQRLTALLNAQAELLYDQLTTSQGQAFDGWNITTGAPTDASDTLDAHAAAIRGLLAAYLVTGDVKYRERALAVFDRMDALFYDPAARMYGANPGSISSVTYTPRRFGMLQGALRDLFELVAAAPGQTVFAQLLETRLARLNKLVLNGWDDSNGNGVVDWPEECVNVVNGLPRGGLQMAERALSGETGAVDDRMADASKRVYASDREHDCIPEISAAQLPAGLANSVTFTVTPAP